MKFALLPCCLLFAAVTANAAEPLSLSDAIYQAQKANENAAIARERLAEADGAWRVAYAELLPQLTLYGQYTPWSKHDGESTQGNIRAELQLFDPASVPRIRSAKRWYEADTLQAHELRRGLAFETANAFYIALAASAVTTAAEKRLQVADEALRQARIRSEAGLADRSTVTRSELESATARTELIRAKNGADKSRHILFFILGAQPQQLDKNAELPTLQDPGMVTPIASAYTALLTEAEKNRADIKALMLSAEAQTIAAKEPVADSLPKLSFRAETTYDDDRSYEKYSNDYRASIVATWTLYDGGARYGLREVLAARARTAHLQAQAAQRHVGLEISNGLRDLETALAAMEQAQVRQRVAQENAKETAARFAQGLATALEQADATVAAFEADIELTRSRFAAQQATLTVEQALGRWPSGTHDPDSSASAESKP